MQFPWRDFGWLVIVIGLAIGLAVEQQRVRGFTANKLQREQSEAKLFELAKAICEPSGGQFRVQEDFDLIWLPRYEEQQWVERVHVPHVFLMPERDDSLATGMLDLELVLAFLCLGMPVSLAMNVLLRKRAPAAGKESVRLSLGSLHIATVIWIVLGASVSIAGFCDSRPFFATTMLGLAVIGIVRCLSYLALPPEQQVDKHYEVWFSNFQSLRAATKFTLRDFFWATIVIGLSVAIVGEHQRARALSVFRGRAEWWRMATEVVQQKYDSLIKQRD